MNKYEQLLAEVKGERSALQKQLNSANESLLTIDVNLDTYNEARDVANAAMMATQTKVKEFIEEIVSLAIQAVFGSDYRFIVNYQIKRGKSEAYLFVEKNGELRNIEDDEGGGMADVAALGLRAVLYALAQPRPRQLLVLDEPGTKVSVDKQAIFAEMLKKLSEVLNVELIVVSHSEDVITYADQTIVVKQMSGVSSASVVDG